ncbi:MAG: hypothetical protein MI799_05515 [Desulfobacterales bacterium]|nr:hypothetical protein [Desulfobacterales bacterium]
MIHLWTFMACLGVWQWPHALLIAAAYPGSPLGKGMPIREMNCLIMIWTLLFSQTVLLFIIQQGISHASLAIPVFLTFILLPVFMAGVLFMPRKRSQSETDFRNACITGFKLTNLAILTLFAAIFTDRLTLSFF